MAFVVNKRCTFLFANWSYSCTDFVAVQSLGFHNSRGSIIFSICHTHMLYTTVNCITVSYTRRCHRWETCVIISFNSINGACSLADYCALHHAFTRYPQTSFMALLASDRNAARCSATQCNAAQRRKTQHNAAWRSVQRRSEGFRRPGRRPPFGAPPPTPQKICNSPKFAKSLKLFTKFGDFKNKLNF